MKDKILKIYEDIKKELKETYTFIYKNPEMSFEEYKSSKILADLLEKYNFKVQRNYLGFETAFKATFDTKLEGPTVGYLCEYDALPGLGHGCGHNMLGTSSVGAAILLSQIEGISGKIVVFGTPAEETSGTKVDMVNKGEFNNVDVAIMMHPGDVSFKTTTPMMALITRQYEFFGKTSHAAASPWEGINALDAQINLFNLINALRQEIRPDARIHGIIKDGGKAPNIIPDYTMSRFYVRADDKAYMLELLEKVDNCAKAAALSTGCELKLSEFENSFDNLVPNEELDNILVECLKEFTKEKIETKALGSGSADAGNVSHVIPTVHGWFPVIAEKCPIHTEKLREATMSEYAEERFKETVCAISQLGYFMLTDKKKLDKVKEQYKQDLKNGKVIPPKGI